MSNSFEKPNIETSFTKPKNNNEQYRRELKKAMKSIAQAVNNELKTNLLGPDAAISMDDYGLPTEELAEDKAAIKAREMYLISKQRGDGEPVTDEMHQEWLKAKENPPSHQKSDLVEMVTTLFLRKGLHKDYVIVRTASYDDYAANSKPQDPSAKRHVAIDNMIVHKATGAVLCAYDDVHSFHNGSDAQKKEMYSKKAASNGGSVIKYGFTFENGELVRKQVENVPKLYIALSPFELEDALRIADTENIDSLTADEEKIFNKIMDMLESQLPAQREEGKVHPKLIKNIDTFAKLLPSMKHRNNQEEENWTLAA